jgi:hypothetical protein
MSATLMTIRLGILRRARAVLNAAGWQLTRIPHDAAPTPALLPAQGLDGVGTHVGLLAAAVARTAGEGPVLELGMGDHSTPLLHLLCVDRLLVSADSSAAWVGRFERFRSETHHLHTVPAWRAFRVIDEHQWAVAFVDCTPSHERPALVERLAGRAIHIVVHDTDPDTQSAAVFGLQEVLDTFAYRSDYRMFRPFTTVVSNVRPFDLTAAEEAAPGQPAGPG